MANNEEHFCNVCKEVTTFFIESDLLWYCDECGKVLGANAAFEDDDEFEEALEEFEDENGKAVYCDCCNNFAVLNSVLKDGMCPNCYNELETELGEKGYVYCEDSGKYIKETAED